ncbi:MAG: hypothetical protein LBM98_02910 [Oscillospiraceae bacterium]|nr:hypothetical protein [Oscillospiraceae bacterium]
MRGTGRTINVGAGFKPALVRGGKGEARPVIASRAKQSKPSTPVQTPVNLRIVGFYVNRGLLRRVSMVRIASAVAASQ